MSYVPSDFDDLTTGFHILDIRENTSDLESYQDGYVDHGLGYKQQYQVYGNDFVPLMFTSHDTRMDFCYKFQGNKQGTFNFVLNTYSGDGYSQVTESIDLYYIQHSVTQDSDGNEVWLYEDFDFSILSIFGTTAMENNEKFDIEVVSQYQGTNNWYDIASFLKNGHEGTLPEEQPIVLAYVRNPIITNYTVRRKDNISEIMQFEFSGTFDNVYMGKVYNSPIEISIQFVNPHTQESELFELVEGEDYTIDGNTFYSGTSSTMSWIDKDIHEVFSEGIRYQLDVFNPGLFVSATDSTYSNLPVFDWGRENDIKYLNVNGKYKLNDTDIITTSGNDVILDVDNYKLNGTDLISTSDNGINLYVGSKLKVNGNNFITPSGNNLYIDKNTKITDNTYYNTNLDTIVKNSIYSTDEIIVGTWINGKPIYRRTFNGTFSHNQTLLSNVNVLVRAYGEGDPGTGLFRQLPYFEHWNGTSYFCNIVHDSTNHTLVVNSYLANSPHNCSMTVTIEYTKTTD